MPPAGRREIDVIDVPIAVRSGHGLTCQRLDAALGQTQDQCASFTLSKVPSPAINCSTKLSGPTAPGEINTWNIAFSE